MNLTINNLNSAGLGWQNYG